MNDFIESTLNLLSIQHQFYDQLMQQIIIPSELYFFPIFLTNLKDLSLYFPLMSLLYSLR